MRARWKPTLILMQLMTGLLAGCQSPGFDRADVPIHPRAQAWRNGEPAPFERTRNEATKFGQNQTSETYEPPAIGYHDRVECGSVPCGDSVLTPSDVFRSDLRDFSSMLGRDARGLVNCRDLSLLAGALGGAIAIRQDWDDEVREYAGEHPDRWGKGSEALGYLGDVYQVPVLLGVYGYSISTSNEELLALSRALLSAYTISGLSTLTVKVLSDTDRPSDEWNDGRFGFPSFHAASCFSIAAVVEEYEGLPTALPVYTLAGLVGWSRIDEQDHDLSDVVFGAALGYVIGKSVARQHRKRESKLRLKPYKHPEEPAGGLAMEWRY